MLAWAFSCKTPEEIGALVRALGKHRYVREAEHRVHWMVDRALADVVPACAEADARLRELASTDRDLDLSSYDPRLWRSATADEIAAIFAACWSGDATAKEVAQKLRALLEEVGLPLPEHGPFDGDPEFPTHPQLVQLSWTLLPVQDLDTERHAGALGALEESGDEVDVTAPVEQEGPDLGVAELTEGAPRGVLVGDFLVWADGPYAYSDYVFRGASKLAKLPDPPEGMRDLDDEEEDEEDEDE